MGKPLKAIPQVTVEDKKASQVLDALKYVIDVREGRGTADQGKMWVTFDDLWEALKNLNPVAGGVLSEEFIAFEDIDAGCFVSVFKDAEDGDKLKVRKACSLVDETESFKVCNGYVLKAYTTGATAVVYYNGINTAYSLFDDLETGSVVYISDTAGEVSQARKIGAKLQMVGMVVKSGILFVPGDVVPDCCGGCSYYEEGNETCSIMEKDVSVVADKSGLADGTFDKAFSTLDGAMTMAASRGVGVEYLDVSLGDEDPDCIDAFYFIAEIAS